MRKKILKVLFQILFVLLFISISSYALLTAYGYQVDLLKKNIVKTSIIDLAGPTETAKVYFDNTLVSDKIPYQVKNVEPGTHYLLILKDGYKIWQKKVDVELNVVTKISDILLIPENFADTGKSFDLSFEFDTVLSNRKWIIFVSQKDNKIYTYKLNEDGSFLIDSIDMSISKQYEFLFAGEDHLAYKDNDKINLLSLSDKTILEIQIPDEFKNFKLSYNIVLNGFYINDGNLFAADIDENGAIKGITLVSEDPVFEKGNFEIINFSGSTYILAKGSLYNYNSGTLSKIDVNVTFPPLINSENNEILYIKNAHEIVRLNTGNKSKYMAGRFGNRVNNIGWFVDDKHIMINTQNKIMLCDFTFENCSNLLNITEDDALILSDRDNQFSILSVNKIITYTAEKKEQ